MQGIYITAIITTSLSLAVIGSIIFWRSPRKERSFLSVLILLEIPICALAFYFIRLPLDGWLRNLLTPQPGIYKFLTTLYAPITEEPAKLWILLIPWVFRRINSKNVIRVAMAIGLGFGIGEMWLVATRLANNPQIGSLPWYSLGGYINERFMVCIMHGVFTCVALRQISKSLILGIFSAISLHFVGNFPIFLAAINFLGLGKSTWQILLFIWVNLYFLSMIGLLIYFSFGTLEKLSLFVYGKAQCPDCGWVYSRPLFLLKKYPGRGILKTRRNYWKEGFGIRLFLNGNSTFNR